MNKLLISSFCNLLFLFCIISGTPYQEMVPEFNRIKSHVFVRKISVPTCANLDYAAYDKNPVLFTPVKSKPKKIPKSPPLHSITFNGLLSNIKNDIEQTPLTSTEKQNPLAWEPLLKKLWGVVKDNRLQYQSGIIAGYKWADPDIYQPYQQISTLFIHSNGDTNQFWVKVEFSPWVGFLQDVSDEDNDGFKEIYGKLSVDSIAPDSLQKMINWIQKVYCTEVLSKEDCIDWITGLASYWYPSRNTDILDLTGQKSWPDNHTSSKIRKELKGLTVNDPLAVIEGKPFAPDKPVYNIFIINNPAPAIKKTADKKAVPKKAPFNSAISENDKFNIIRFNKEIEQFGSYNVWAEKNEPFLKGLSSWAGSFPEEQMGLEGTDEWLFFRKSIEYILGGDPSMQPIQKNPIPHLVQFKRYLQKQNVSLLFVAVPNKEEIYYEKLSQSIPAPSVKIVNPYSRKILKDLQDSGVEVIDLLPVFLEEKGKDKQESEFLYQIHDTHWTSRGLELAAKLISQRIKSYEWYKNIDKTQFRVIDTTLERLGDIVDRIPQNRRQKYKPVTLRAMQVRMPDGSLYKGGKTSPIMLIGDSFTGIFESVDCKSAGVGSHIAVKTGVPVEIITSWGGGPLVRKKAMKARAEHLNFKKVVVYLMSARDLFNYTQNWEPFPEKK